MKQFIVLLIVACCWQSPALSFNNDHATPVVSQQQLLTLQAQNSPILLLDVRSAEEYAAGHIDGAVNIAHDQLADNLAMLADAKDKKIVVYCRSGRRAGIAEDVLQQHGFNQVYHLQGDMNGWQAAALPVVKP